MMRNQSQMAPMLFTLCCTVTFAGCAGLRWGQRWGQGTIDLQKARATVHDPFPLNDIGPEVVGARPREFYSPQAEASRNQNTNTGYQLYGRP